MKCKFPCSLTLCFIQALYLQRRSLYDMSDEVPRVLRRCNRPESPASRSGRLTHGKVPSILVTAKTG